MSLVRYVTFFCMALPASVLCQGNIGIGKPLPQYTLDIESQDVRAVSILNNSSLGGSLMSLRVENRGTGFGNHYGVASYLTGPAHGTHYGFYAGMQSTGNGPHYGAFHWLTGTGFGPQVGSMANITNSGDGDHYGSKHHLLSDGAGDHHGVYNVLSGDGDGWHYGVRTHFTGQGSGAHFGVQNDFDGISNAALIGVSTLIEADGGGNCTGTHHQILGSGDGDFWGTYNNLGGSGSGEIVATSNAIQGTGDGVHYGCASYLNASGSGDKYAVYGFIHGAAGGTGYAGYFSGDVTVTGTFSNPSDRKLKSAITPLRQRGVLEKLRAINIYQYEYNQRNYPTMPFPKGVQTGVMADELNKVFPELVQAQVHPEMEISAGDSTVHVPKVEYLGVNYIGMIPHLIKGIQELSEQVAMQDQMIRELKTELASKKK